MIIHDICLFKRRKIPYDVNMNSEKEQPILIEIYDYTILFLIGASLSGKTAFAS